MPTYHPDARKVRALDFGWPGEDEVAQIHVAALDAAGGDGALDVQESGGEGAQDDDLVGIVVLIALDGQGKEDMAHGAVAGGGSLHGVEGLDLAAVGDAQGAGEVDEGPQTAPGLAEGVQNAAVGDGQEQGTARRGGEGFEGGGGGDGEGGDGVGEEFGVVGDGGSHGRKGCCCAALRGPLIVEETSRRRRHGHDSSPAVGLHGVAVYIPTLAWSALARHIGLLSLWTSSDADILRPPTALRSAASWRGRRRARG